jgi:Tol biopolymer transport system component
MNREKQKNAALALAGLLIAGIVSGRSSAWAQTKPAVELEAAIAKEQVNGDLRAAVAAYQKIAANATAPREVRAKALLHLAACYEKQGQQSRAVYEQIVRDYADQPAATQAGAKLAAMRRASPEPASTALTQRTFELPVAIAGPTVGRLTDGQRVVYVDEGTGFLMISDLSGTNKRVVLRPKGFIDYLYPSRDLSMVFMQLTRADGSGVSVIVGTDGTGYREVGDDRQCGAAWSWDDSYFLACRHYQTGPADLLKISTADGQVRKLQTTEAHAIRVSPDGKFIAYSTWERNFQQIFVAPAEGGEPQLISDRAVLMDWTRDGGYLVVAMDVSGSEALYLAPVKAGRKAGEPVFVRYGYFGLGHVNMSGSFVYPVPVEHGSYDTWLGSLDSGGRPSDWKPLALRNGNASPNPTWSPDSARIAYSTANQAAGQTTQSIRVRDIASGEDRELYKAGTGSISCSWAAQPGNLFCTQHTEKQTEILSLSLDSGRAEPLGAVPSSWTIEARSIDDRAIYLMNPAHLMRWDIGTRQMTAVEQSTGIIPPSPDERWIVRRINGSIEIRPMTGSTWKVLGPIAADGGVFKLASVTPDGKWLLYQTFDPAGKRSFFRVATDGSRQPERVGDLPGKGAALLLSISPDGHKIIADAAQPSEMWILENFEPKH